MGNFLYSGYIWRTGILESLQGKLIQSQDFNLSVLKYFLRSHTYRVGLACWIVLALIQCVAIVLVFSFMLKGGKEEPKLVPVQVDDGAVESLAG